MPMAAILAHFTSIQSPVHHPMSRFNFFHTFIVYTILLPCSLCADLIYTCKNQTCGGEDIPYPFGRRGSGCGLPSFQIDCVEESRRVIEIDSQNYTVVDIFRNNQTSTIVEDDYFSGCASSYYIFDEIYDKSIFDSVEQLNITLKVRKCGTLCLLDDVSSALLCPLESEAKVLGGLAHWNITDNPLYQQCNSCESKGGSCGYSISDPEKFFCFCEDSNHQYQCPGGIWFKSLYICLSSN